MSAPVEPLQIVSGDDRLFVELSTIRERLVLLAEEISIKLEANMKPNVAAALAGDDQAKAAHTYRSQARKIQAELKKVEALAESFRSHIH